MKRSLAALMSFACLSTALTSFAEEALTTGVSDVFGCTLRDGKTMDNVWSNLERLASMEIPSQAPPDSGFSIFLWTPVRSASDYDFVWGVNSSSVNAMAQGLTDYLAAPGAEAMGVRLGETADCVSGIVDSRQLRAGTLGNKADRVADALVEIFACTMNENATLEKRDQAIEFWQTEVENIPSSALKTFSAWLWTPFRGGTGEADWYWVGTYPDLKTWAQGSTDYYGSKGGQAADAKFNAVSACRADLWAGYWIIAPTSTP